MHAFWKLLAGLLTARVLAGLAAGVTLQSESKNFDL
jgi:hypothetical protein